ncbi:hypothetical protein PG997_005493 [Apiospora hydei]|uniref:Uncharacterized protein n=1 Tax=Apiospora hydei TaxID=1337664 RepID=A0ABR1WL63_9PEZI
MRSGVLLCLGDGREISKYLSPLLKRRTVDRGSSRDAWLSRPPSLSSIQQKPRDAPSRGYFGGGAEGGGEEEEEEKDILVLVWYGR